MHSGHLATSKGVCNEKRAPRGINPQQAKRHAKPAISPLLSVAQQSKQTTNPPMGSARRDSARHGNRGGALPCAHQRRQHCGLDERGRRRHWWRAARAGSSDGGGGRGTAAHAQRGPQRWADGVVEPGVLRARGQRLDVVVRGDVREQQLQLVSGEKAAGAAELLAWLRKGAAAIRTRRGGRARTP